MSTAGPDGFIFEIQRWCTDDGPGIRSTVFFQGCPLRCAWCCNPEAWAGGAEHGLGGRRMSAEAILAAVTRDRVFYRRSGGGVTFSGGEATTQPELLLFLAERLRAEGVHLALETCGHFPWERTRAALALLDLVYLDLKHMDGAAHARLTGVDNQLILANAVRMAEAGIPLVVRVPLIPGCNDNEGNLAATAAFARDRLGGAAIELMPYHTLGLGKYRQLGLDYTLPALQPGNPEALARVRAVLAAHGGSVLAKP